MEITEKSIVEVSEWSAASNRGDTGEVIEVYRMDGKVAEARVRFGPHAYKREERISAQDLKVLSAWPLAARCDFLFGRGNPHSTYSINEPFGEKSVCMHVAHDGHEPPKATRRILLNAWGAVCEFDACEEHESHDGYCMDIIPWGEKWRKK